MQINKSVPRGPGWRSRYAGRNINPNGRQSTRYESMIQRPSSPPVGPLLQTLSETNLLAVDQAQSSCGRLAEITHCEDVASFSWLDRNEPTILIPGTTFSSSRTQPNARSLTYRVIQERRRLGHRSMSHTSLRRTRVTIFVT